MSCCKVEIGSHYVKFTETSVAFKALLVSLAQEMTTYKLSKIGRRFVKVHDKTFASANAARTEFRFHRHQWDFINLKATQRGMPIPESAITRKATKEPRKVKLALDPGWVPRDYQVPIIDYVLAPGSCKTINLQTGRGKTSITLKSVELIGDVLLVAVLGRYFDKWITDITDQYGLEEGELITARGSREFKDLLKLARSKRFDCKVILTTINTLEGYINEYRLTGLEGQPAWCVPPEDIYDVLGVGVKVIDEVHQHFHTVYLIDLYTNVRKAINLSATLKFNTPKLNEMCSVAFPMDTRINGGKYVKVADCTAVHYHIKDYKKVRCNGFAKSYSHVVFEESIISQPKIWEQYLKLLQTMVDKEYINIRQDGQKLIIFAARVETCELIRAYLAEIYSTLTVEKYTSEDDYDTFTRADIIVSTIGSAGTAIDIPGLITVIMTTVINSISANEQALGRLRDLRIPGFKPRFIYLTCDDIPKHKEYTRNKVELFEDMVFTHKHVYYETKL